MSQKNKGAYLSRRMKKDMARLTQRSPRPSSPSLKAHLCCTLSFIPPATEGILLSKAHFPTCALDTQATSVYSRFLLSVCFFASSSTILANATSETYCIPFYILLSQQSLPQTFLCCGIYLLILWLLFRQIFTLEPRLA